MGEENTFQSPPKNILRTSQSVKQIITVALDMKTWRVDPGAFQSILLDISRILFL